MRLSQNATVLAAAMIISAGLIGYGVSSAAASSKTAPPPAPAGSSRPIHPNATAGSTARPSSPYETTFTSLRNCRIVSTATRGGKMANNSTRSFYVYGGTGMSTQGGTSGGCGIPDYATTISARITSVLASGNGAFVAFPTGAATGQGTLYYAKGVNVTTSANLELGAGTAKVLSVKNVGGPADLVVDVNGYFAPPIEGMISPTAGIYSGSNRILSATHPSTGTYLVTVDRDVEYCTPTVTPYDGDNVYASAYDFSDNTITINMWNLDNSTHLPSPADLYVYLSVAC